MQQLEIQQDAIYSLEAECGVLGSLIIGAKKTPQVISDTMGKLDTEDFYELLHRAIYDAICGVYIETSVLDPVILRERLKQDGQQFEGVGGVDEYLTKIIETLTSAANLDYFVEIVQRKALNRRVIQVSEQIRDISLSLEQPDEKIALLQEAALALTPLQKRTDIFQVSEIVDESLDDMLSNQTGLKTGFEKLDWHIGSLQKGEMIVIAARPSMGKTALVTDLSLNIARAGKKVVLYSLEMTPSQLTQRMLSSIARVDIHKVRRQSHTEEDVEELSLAVETLKKYDIQIMNTATLTPTSFAVSLRGVKNRFGADLCVIDYLQLMTVKGRSENRQQETAKISRGIKSAALGEGLPIVVLSQLNRECESTISKKPQLSHLRDSGCIEQDADVVVLMHRPDWYHRGEPDYNPTHTAVLQVAKSRNGPTGELELFFHEQFVSFSNFEPRDESWDDFDKQRF